MHRETVKIKDDECIVYVLDEKDEGYSDDSEINDKESDDQS